MIYLFLLLIPILGYYIVLVIKFKKNFNHSNLDTKNNKNIVPVSVIIAIKNGEASLPHLIECLQNQTYKGDVEFILVDDQSTDKTKSIIQNIEIDDIRFKFVSSNSGDLDLKFKKKALDAGIKIANHEWLLFTDVDCRPPATWVEEMVEYFIDDNDFVIGMSKVFPNKSTVSIFQSIDFQMLMAASFSQANIGQPWACTGQNQAYRKSLFKKVDGFKHISTLLQGDDSVFMQICKYANANIVAAMTACPMIARTENNWWSFLKQRMRWAGDSKYMLKLCPKFFFASVITFLTNLILFIFILFNINILSVFLFSLKANIEYSFFLKVNASPLKIENNENNIWKWYALQFPYIISVGSLSMWAHKLFGWRGSKS